MKKKRAILMLVVLFITTSIVFASGGQSKPAGGKHLIWFTEQMDDVEHDRWTKYYVNPFMAANPGVTVEISPSANYEEVLKIQLSSGAGPDVCNLGGPTSTIEYVSRLHDLTDRVTSSGLDKVVFKWALDACRVNGRIYSIPNSYEAMLLWYNEDMFAANGWKPPTNYTELTNLCNAMQAKGIIPISFGTSNFKPINEQFVGVALAGYAGRDNVKKALNGEMKWTDPLFVQSITILNDMWQKGWINDKKSHAITSDEGNALFYMQRTAMNLTGTWMIEGFGNEIKDFKYNAVPFPSLREGVPPTISFGVGGVVGINNATKYPDEAFSFIKFLFDNKKNQALAVGIGAQPLPMDVDSSLYPSTMRNIDKSILDLLETTQQNLQQAGHVMWTYWPAETRTYMMNNIENVYLGTLTPLQFLERSQEIYSREFSAGKVAPVY